ncbi:hypothetical protein PR202_ga13284 [Eleusine coracana subsp. coracana]|uniref:Uncharacterized protein n=1 Tax=Eleusine coracana subsp. coracana TaxID=191504 RepID=A0AAV5CDM9_ELECO|nr:hypothetical protein PR202_ga13284 [Eleusine coracana subsp. coracana]
MRQEDGERGGDVPGDRQGLLHRVQGYAREDARHHEPRPRRRRVRLPEEQLGKASRLPHPSPLCSIPVAVR